MESIAEIVKNLLIIIIVTSFLELLLPEGGLKPFVRFAIGLFVIITVLNPVLSFVFDKDEFEIKWWDTGPMQYQEQLISRTGEGINKSISDYGSYSLKEKIEGQINALVLLVPGVKDSLSKVEIDGKGGILSLEIELIPEVKESGEDSTETLSLLERQKMQQVQTEAVRQKVNELIKNLYGFEQVKVDIVDEGGEKDVGRMD